MKYKDYKKYKIPDDRFRELMYFSCQYPNWKAELKQQTFIKSPSLDSNPHGSAPGDPTGESGSRYADLSSKCKLIEGCVMEAGADIYDGLLKGVTTRNCTPNWLRSKGLLFCGNDKYYTARRRYFWLLDQRRG